MKLDRVKEIAAAVLYEGYILYPYRASSIKNRQRWTFGGVFPADYASFEGGDPSSMQTQCLLRGTPRSIVEVRVRFLHLLPREIGQLHDPVAELARDAVTYIHQSARDGHRRHQIRFLGGSNRTRGRSAAISGRQSGRDTRADRLCFSR